MSTPVVAQLHVSESENEDLFASPKPSQKAHPKVETIDAPLQRSSESRYDTEQAKKSTLQRELNGVRSINEVIEGVISSLESAKGNMDTVSRTVTSASTLLNTWTRILSQTEHNQRLILNPKWKGASADMTDMENELVLKAQAQERIAAEEERRREDARRRAEDEERQRQAGSGVRIARGSRGRSRGSTRGLSSSGYIAGGTSTVSSGRGSQSGRGGTGIRRGLGILGGRGRGVR